MSELSPRLALPLMMAAQSQKHVTHNEALLMLDLLTQLTVEGFAATDPPADPANGQLWALGPAPTGEWAGQGNRLAAWFEGEWQFLQPQTGWRAAQGTDLRLWTGNDWQRQPLPDLSGLPGVGINAGHDATNRLSVSAAATLLNHEGAGHQLKLNKAGAGETASLLFQTGFSGRAEMGTAGSDAFAIKVSADGSAWHTGLSIAPATGAPALAEGATIAGARALHMGNLLGSVAQAAGEPTGAVIERGANANGEYTRFADGTQIVQQTRVIDVTSTAAQSFTNPVPFEAGMLSVFVSHLTTPNVALELANIRQVQAQPGSCVVQLKTAGTTGGNPPGDAELLRITAMGRWF